MEKKSAIFSRGKELRVIKHRRKKNWTDPGEMEAFLYLLEENCEELSYLKRNLTLYCKMSYKMAKMGFHREPLELRKKVSNIICKYKQEKSLGSTDWPYLKKVDQILTKMKKHNHTGVFSSSSEKKSKIDESNAERSRNEMQKILLITPGSSNVSMDEADMETILKAMNGEDVSSRNDESSTSLEVIDGDDELPDSDRAEEEEDDDDDSRSNDMVIETPNQPLQKTNSPAKTSEGPKVSDQCIPSMFSIKRTLDHDRIKVEKSFSIAKEPAEKTQELKPSNSKKDEVDLYAELLASKLKRMDEKSRHIAMNKIDNMLFKIKMEQIEGQQRPQNLGTPSKTLPPLVPNTRE